MLFIRRPAFINLQQYYVEEYLIDRAQEFPDLIDLRFKNNVIGHDDRGDHVVLTIAGIPTYLKGGPQERIILGADYE